MPRYAVLFSYDGSAYAGYQRQAGSLPTIQGLLEDRFVQAFHLPVVLHASGRTDAGVHARAQVAHFDLSRSLPGDKMVYAWNRHLPEDIRILEVRETDPNFHARKMAVGKRYAYHVTFESRPSAIGHAYRIRWPYPCEVESLGQILAPLVGTHDFTGFCGPATSVKTFVRTLDVARFDLRGQEGTFTFMGDGFLRHMVRIMVGTALDIGSGSRPADAILRALETGDRSYAGQTLAGSGLTLEEVYYDQKAYAHACDFWKGEEPYA